MKCLDEMVKHAMLLLRLSLTLWNVRNKIILSCRNINMIWGGGKCVTYNQSCHQIWLMGKL